MGQDQQQQGQEPEPQLPEEDVGSPEDYHESERVRHSMRTRQPRRILTYDELGEPSITLRK